MAAKAQISVPCDLDLKRKIEAAARAVRRPTAFWVRDAVAAALANSERQQQGGARAA
jgi:predicted transcriptional regulator